MNTLVAVAIAPVGVGDELGAYVADVVRIIRESGLSCRTNSMFTEIEGEWDDVMRVVRDATFVLAERGIRTEVVLKADIRPGFTNTMERKVRVVDELLDGAPVAEVLAGTSAVNADQALAGAAPCASVASSAAAPADSPSSPTA